MQLKGLVNINRTLILVIVAVCLSNIVAAFDYSEEYNELGESISVYGLTLDGTPYKIFNYEDTRIIFDTTKSKPLFDGQMDEGIGKTIFKHEYYHNRYTSVPKDTFGKILNTNLDLDVSVPCEIINYDKVLIDTALSKSEDYIVKKYIPKKCVDAPLDCKELANNIKKTINSLASIDKYATPQITLAVYCKGESAFIIPNIMAPAKELDAIFGNLQARSYLTGQLESLEETKNNLNQKLIYSVNSPMDFLRDAYFIAKETAGAITKGQVKATNKLKEWGNKVADALETDVHFELKEEPKLWSEKLEQTRAEINAYFSDSDRAKSVISSDEAYKKSIKRLESKKNRNIQLQAEARLKIGSIIGWYADYAYLLIYDYNTSYMDNVKFAQNSLKQAERFDSEYKYNSGFAEYTKSLSYISQGITERTLSDNIKRINLFKIVLIIGGAVLLYKKYYQKNEKN